MNTLNSVTGQDLQRLAREREAQNREAKFWVKVACATAPIVPALYWLHHTGTGIRSIDSVVRSISEEALLIAAVALTTLALGYTCAHIAIAERHPGRIPTLIAALYYFVVIGLITGFVSYGFVVFLKVMDSMSV